MRDPSQCSTSPPPRGWARFDEAGVYTPRQVTADDLDGMSLEDAIAGTIVEFDDGDIVKGTVVKVDKDEVLLDIGFKSEGVIPARELSIRHDVDPHEVVSMGDQIEALVLQKEDKEGRLILSKKRAQYERAWGTIEAIKERDGVVSGPVIEVVKGGLILDIGLRGFLPASLVELRRVRDLQPYVGRTLEAKIIELDKNRNNVVLSRRAWLEETQKEQRDEFLANLKPGEVRRGVVSSVVNFGAFVDLGGMDGLIHVSELSWKHVDHPSSVVTVGDEVEVRVLDVDLDRERISLSLKATQQDPWQEFANAHRVGELVYGRVTKLVPFGAFVQVGDGHRGSGPHLGDGGPPRRPARAGGHPGRGAVGQDHRHRPAAPPHQPVDQAGGRGRRGGGRVPRALRRARLRRRGQLHRPGVRHRVRARVGGPGGLGRVPRGDRREAVITEDDPSEASTEAASETDAEWSPEPTACSRGLDSRRVLLRRPHRGDRSGKIDSGRPPRSAGGGHRRRRHHRPAGRRAGDAPPMPNSSPASAPGLLLPDGSGSTGPPWPPWCSPIPRPSGSQRHHPSGDPRRDGRGRGRLRRYRHGGGPGHPASEAGDAATSSGSSASSWSTSRWKSPSPAWSVTGACPRPTPGLGSPPR